VPDIRYLRKMINGMPVVVGPSEIDVTTADELRSVLIGSAVGGHATVIVDMTGTRFCDSAGLRELIRAHRRALAEGGELRLVVPAVGAVARVLALTCVDRVMHIFGSLEDALGAGPGTVIVPLPRRTSPRPRGPGHRSGNPARGA
jgi:anti-sigma B factor antagonist